MRSPKRAETMIARLALPVEFKAHGRVDWTSAFVQPSYSGPRGCLWTGERGPDFVGQPGGPSDGVAEFAQLRVELPPSWALDVEPYHDGRDWRLLVLDVIAPIDDNLVERRALIAEKLVDWASQCAYATPIQAVNREQMLVAAADCLERGFTGAYFRSGRAGYCSGPDPYWSRVPAFARGRYPVVDVRPDKRCPGRTLLICEAEGGDFEAATRRRTLDEALAAIGREVEVAYSSLVKQCPVHGVVVGG